MLNQSDGTEETLVAYRLGEVEKGVKEIAVSLGIRDQQINDKLDRFIAIREQVAINSLQIANLIKSRDKLISAMVVISTGLILTIFNAVFKIL